MLFILDLVHHRCDKRQKIIINVNKRVYSEKIVNFCKLKVNVGYTERKFEY